jgi:kynureninase
MKDMDESLAYARSLDAQDELAHFRKEFLITNPQVIYLDGNSLGRLPKRTAQALQKTVEVDWGDRLIRGWNEGWMALPSMLAGKLASLLGAQPGEICFADSTSVNLFKLAVAALRANPDRKKIVSDVFNFPSDLYILQGVIDLLGENHQLELAPTQDGITIAEEDLKRVIDEDTALVCLSHVVFKSAFLYEMQTVTRLAHENGALILWDLSHSAGAVPVDLNGCQADMAVGCTYKYLNGGPGAPAYLYVRQDLQDEILSPIWGWFADRRPFQFELEFSPAEGAPRYAVGTPPVISMKAIEPALDILMEAGVEPLRQKSIKQTGYLIELAEAWLLPLEFSIGTPLEPNQRGSHVSLRHPEGYRINRAMIEPVSGNVRVIPDFRTPDNIRLGIAPLYTTFEEIHKALVRMREIVIGEEYRHFSIAPVGVT